jgi:membrane associated rhomboid family serine protease
MQQDPDFQPAVNPIPPLILALFVVLMGIEVMFQLGMRGIIGGPSAVGWRQAAVQDYAYSAEFARWMWEHGELRPEFLVRFVAYPFVHASFTQALFAGVMLLALGKFVAEVMHPVAVLFLFFASAFGGALGMWALGPDGGWLIGAFPPVYGLIGAYTYLLWVQLGWLGEARLNAFRLIAVLAGLQLVFGVLFGFSQDWPADLGGALVGLVLAPVLAPGGVAALLRRLRDRG